MCVVDWAIMGAWAQFVAILITAGVAWVQLNKFTEGERVKNTLSVIKEFIYERVSLFGTPITAQDAASLLCQPLTHARYVELLLIPSSVRAAADQAELERIVNCAVVFHNYFDAVGDLFQRGVIDSELFLSRLSLLLLVGYLKSGEILKDARGRNIDVTSFMNLLRAAHAYRTRIGDQEYAGIVV